MKSLKFILILISLSIFACSESKTKDSKKANDYMNIEVISKSSILSKQQTVDSSSILLTIERGAFHYDKFILKDTIITFYPSSENWGKENDKYNQVSEQIISKQTLNKFIEKIIEDGFFELRNSYSSNTSCNSHLTVTFKFNNQTKKIVSEDFERECPELLKFIEQEIIRMHSKNLKRILLPG
ncbi:hypothetical protein [Aquimarina longa]|uniref:DUF6438 domain-containing protein n=1 Tax=Aquimarina longa TaxID=1080221 RepID=UPI000781B281|nr:hypothetical protein [Aquimarina longa]